MEQKERPNWKKIYSVHAPEVECIGKGKAHKKYEFGVKVSLVATSKEGFVIGAQALHGNPYDGHTLRGALAQAGELAGRDSRAMSLWIWATGGMITGGQPPSTWSGASSREYPRRWAIG